jgi:hypothetical protein
MQTNILIVVVFATITIFMPMKAGNNTRHVPSVGAQENNSGASIFEAYDETKNTKQRFDRLDGYALYLKENPSFRAYVISYGGRRSCRDEALRRARFAKDYLSKVKGIDRQRINALDGGYVDQWAVYLWVGAQGEAPPTPMPTVDRSQVQIVRNCRLKASRVRNSVY